MRNRNAIVAIALAAFIVAQGCASIFGRAGVESREHVLLPAIEQAWPAVSMDIASGVNDAQAKGDLTSTAAVDLFDRTADWGVELSAESPRVSEMVALRARDWSEFMFYAVRGIAARESAGEIGPAVAVELQERINRFDEALTALAGEPTDPE
jgi:hypothetical protein